MRGPQRETHRHRQRERNVISSTDVSGNLPLLEGSLLTRSHFEVGWMKF